MNFQAVIASLLFLHVLHVYGQNCGFVDTSETSFEMDEASESTEPGALLWQHNIFNVVHSSSLNTSHFPYITGLRYTSYYQYVAADIFQRFPDTIRAQYLERNVTFTCADGGIKNYYFRLRIRDENTKPPQFNNLEYTIDATVPWPIETPINSVTPIIISDADYEEENADILITSTNANFRAEAIRLNPGPYPDTYYYDVKIYFNRANVVPNTYNILLVADDGWNSETVPVVINVVGS